jgi:hypothetical protein
MAPGFVPFIDTNGDTISYGGFDSLVFGAAVMPTDGINALNGDLSTSVNSPTNFLGESGSVDASPSPPNLPGLGGWGLGFAMLTLIAAASTLVFPATGSFSTTAIHLPELLVIGRDRLSS